MTAVHMTHFVSDSFPKMWTKFVTVTEHLLLKLHANFLWFQSKFSMSHCSIVNLAGYIKCLSCLDSIHILYNTLPGYCHFFTPSILCQDMVSIISGLQEFLCMPLFLFSNLYFFWIPLQRDEAKCPSLPHSCTCTQDSIGPQGPPGPSVKTSLILPFNNKLFFSEVKHVVMMIAKPWF